MEDDSLDGHIAFLPDGSKIFVELIVDGLATCRRVEGRFRGQIVVIDATKLRQSVEEFPFFEVLSSCPKLLLKA